jgi:hypothetical protein
MTNCMFTKNDLLLINPFYVNWFFSWMDDMVFCMQINIEIIVLFYGEC